MSQVILNLGCGNDLRPDAINIDIVQPKRILENIKFVQDDVLDLASQPNESADLIIANFILEHVHIDKVGYALYKWNRVLKVDGILWCKVPDFGVIVQYYINGLNGHLSETESFNLYKKMNYHLLNPGEDSHRSLWTAEFAKIIFPTEGFEITNIENEGFKNWYLNIAARKVSGS